jgi:acetyl esterase/lipase
LKTKLQDFTIPLWTGSIPNYQDVGETEYVDTSSDVESYKLVTEPAISIFFPSKKNSSRQAVLIIPGGGYQAVVHKWEGSDVAKWLNSNGITAIVLKYRLPNAKNNIVRDKSPIMDAAQAFKLIKENAVNWNIDINNIGVMGFSAGGHLASTLGTHFNDNLLNDQSDVLKLRPNFMVLVYPVISMEKEFTHIGSRENLFGSNPELELMEYYSSENYVSKNTPPSFLVHTSDDEVVDVENTISFYKALRNKKVNSELHVFPHGEHGFSLANGLGQLESWKSLCINWLRNYNK